MHTRADAQLLQPQNEQVEFINPPEGAKNGERVGHIATAMTSCLHEHHCITTTIIAIVSIIGQCETHHDSCVTECQHTNAIADIPREPQRH